MVAITESNGSGLDREIVLRIEEELVYLLVCFRKSANLVVIWRTGERDLQVREILYFVSSRQIFQPVLRTIVKTLH